MAKVKNLERLLRRMQAIGPESRSAIRQALAEGADQIVNTAKSLAPVSANGSHGWEPGMLRESIVSTFGGPAPKYSTFRNGITGDPDLQVTISAGNTDVRYAHLVEFGTKPRKNGGKFKGTDHPGTAAQPFFYPAYRLGKKAVLSRINRAVRKAARTAAAKGA